MNKKKPVVSWENISFSRNEKGGYLSVLSKSKPEYYVQLINPTARQIMELCNGRSSLEEIQDKMIEKYSMVSRDKIIKDVNSTLLILYEYGFVNWEGGNPFEAQYDNYKRECENGITVVRSDERDYREISRIIKTCGIDQDIKGKKESYFYLNPSFPISFYNEILLRNRIFGFKENFYILKKNQEEKALLSTLSNIPSRKVLSIGLIIAKDDTIRKDHVFYLLRSAINDSINQVYDFSKITCDLPSNVDNSEIILCLEKAGFSREATLKDEFGRGIDNLVYSFALCHEQIELSCR